MPTSRADLILHPVRMRLLAHLARRHLTAHQLSDQLSDIPQTTLYYHLGLLMRAGLLRIVAEHRVRGTVEKVYTLADDQASVGPADVAHASRDDHLRYFTVFITTILGDFTRYLQQDAASDLVADGVGFNQTPFYLSDEEFTQAAEALNHALLPFLHNQPAPHRRRHLFTTIVFPDADMPDADTTK